MATALNQIDQCNLAQSGHTLLDQMMKNQKLLNERKEIVSQMMLKFEFDKTQFLKTPDDRQGQSQQPVVQMDDSQYSKTLRKRQVDMSYSAEVYHKIQNNDYQLLAAERVPQFIMANNSEMFKDCCNFFREN